MIRGSLFLYIIGILLIGLTGSTIQAQEVSLTQASTVSLITVSRGTEIWNCYGHTALRVKDDSLQMDLLFNYGMFDFNKPHFIYHFCKGETDYQLGIETFDEAYIGFQLRNLSVEEQILNLSYTEREAIWAALLNNYKVENRCYRYNYYYDNCSIRPLAVIETHLKGKLKLQHTDSPYTFRELVHECSSFDPWITFGIDLLIASPSDRPISYRETFFLPHYMAQALDSTYIIDGQQNSKKLVTERNLLCQKEDIKEPPRYQTWQTPIFVFGCYLLLIVALCALIYLTGWSSYLVDSLTLLPIGMVGVIIMLMTLFSEHPSLSPNWVLLWMHPGHLVSFFIGFFKKARKINLYYHYANGIILLLTLVGWGLLPQKLNPASAPIIISLLAVSIVHILRSRPYYRK